MDLEDCSRIARELAVKYSVEPLAVPCRDDFHTWAVKSYDETKTILLETIKLLNSSRSTELLVQDKEQNAISLHNPAIGSIIDVFLDLKAGAGRESSAVRLCWKKDNNSSGEVIVIQPFDDEPGMYWYSSHSDALFATGDSKWIADTILSFLIRGTLGIEGISP